jgi:hypothetical protein
MMGYDYDFCVFFSLSCTLVESLDLGYIRLLNSRLVLAVTYGCCSIVFFDWLHIRKYTSVDDG